MNTIHLKPLNDVMASLDQEMEKVIEGTRARFQERKETIEAHRRLIPMLDAEGFEFNIYSWSNEAEIRISLGEMPRGPRGRKKFVAKLNAIRRICECPLKLQHKDINHCSKKVRLTVTLSPEKYPGIIITYLDRVPKGGKCKVVRTKVKYVSRSLVCES